MAVAAEAERERGGGGSHQSLSRQVLITSCTMHAFTVSSPEMNESSQSYSPYPCITVRPAINNSNNGIMGRPITS